MKRRRLLMKMILLIVSLPFVLSTVFVFATPVEAASTCTCFCATTTGAQTLASATTAETCADKCPDEKDGQMLVCAAGPDEYPSRDPWCFSSESMCVKYNGKLNTEYQPPQCLQGSHFCLPDPDLTGGITLSVAIGDIVHVDDLGEYVGLVYIWLIGTMSTIAIILIMFYGVQYVLSAGMSEAANATKGIQRSVIGLILLLSVSFLLSTINPYLVRLQMPQLPLIQSVDLVGEGSCEYLRGTLHNGEDYTVQNGAITDSPFVGTPYTMESPTSGTSCGSIAEVTKDSEGQDVLEGTTCQFEYCPDDEDGNTTRCFGRGSSAQCFSCRDILPEEIDETGVSPSVTTCENLTAPDEYTGDGKTLVTKNYCFYTQDPGLVLSNLEGIAAAASLASLSIPPVGAVVVGAVTLSNAADIYKGTCAGLSLDCQKIKARGCSGYNQGDVEVYTGETDNELTDVGSGWLSGSVNMEYICTNDPCDAAGVDGSCGFSESSNTCYSPSRSTDASIYTPGRQTIQ